MISRGPSRQVRFSQDDLELFARASGDLNPLHLSESYARRTAYGRPVVYGVMGAFAALAALGEKEPRRPERIVLDFTGALFTDIDYDIRIVESNEQAATVEIRDGSRTMLKTDVEFRASAIDRSGDCPLPAPAAHEAASIDIGGDVLDSPATGTYEPSVRNLNALMTRFGLNGTGFGASDLGLLLWTSYVTGMELPGERSLFARLAIDLTPASDDMTWPVEYTAHVLSYDDRFELLRTEGQVLSEGRLVAGAEIRSFVRRKPIAPDFRAMRMSVPAIGSLRGRAAFVTGASRGLGAVIAGSLVAQGCTVFANYHKSRDEAERLQRAMSDGPGRLVLIQGNAGDPAFCRNAAAEVARQCGGLDILVCNACSALVPLSIDTSSVERILAYIKDNTAYAAAPLAAFAETLDERSGQCVIMSSIFVEDPPPQWPHYVSAKRAAEGLAESAAKAHERIRFLIARPPRLRTDLSNLPMSHADAMEPAAVAASIITRLATMEQAGGVEYLSDFQPRAMAA